MLRLTTRCSHGVLMLALGASVLGVTGCGDKLASLRGTVYVDGKPAPEGLSLMFRPTDRKLLPASAMTDVTGRYVAKFTFRKDGIQPGEYIAHLTLYGGNAAAEPPPPEERSRSSGRPAFQYPEKYYEEISRVTVGAGRNVVDLNISTKE